MQLDYFYGSSGEQFRFYQIPALLLEDEQYRKIRDTAKVLYGILLSQMALSRKNNWIEKDTGRVYIHYNLSYLAQCMGHSKGTITRAMQELCEAGLLQRRRRGRGLPDVLYVMDFTSIHEKTKKEEMTKEKQSDPVNKEEGKTEENKTEEKNPSRLSDKKEIKSEISVTDIYRDLIKKQIDYPFLMERYPYDQNILEELLSVMTEAITSKRQYLRVNGENRAANEVQNRLKRIDVTHIEYILECVKKNTKKIINPPLFLLTALYNAPVTINTYYNALAAHDLSTGFFADTLRKEKNNMVEGTAEGKKKITPSVENKETVGDGEKENDGSDIDYDAIEALLEHQAVQGIFNKGG